MESEKCLALLKAIEIGNLSGAAAEMGYTPSGMSRMMASLEQEIGLSLLERSKSGVSPTPDCKRLIPALSELVAAARTVSELAESIRGAEVGHVRIGVAYPNCIGTLTEALSAFRNEHPGVRVDIIAANSTPLAESMRKREVDLCIMSRREINCRWTNLFENEEMLIVSSEHPLSRRASVPASMIAREDFVEVYPDEETDGSLVLERRGIVPNIKFSVGDTQTAHELVAAGLGIALMSKLHAHDLGGRVSVLHLDPPAIIEVGIALPDGVILPPAVEALAAFITPLLIGK